MGFSLVPDLYAIDTNVNAQMFELGKADFDPKFFLGLGLVLFLASLVWRFIQKRRAEQIKANLQKYRKEQQASNQPHLDVTENSRQLLEDLARKTGADLQKMLSSNRYFEKIALQHYRSNPGDPFFDFIQGIREELGYIFYNRQAQFVCSQMLQPGQKIQADMRIKGKKHSYVTTILNSSQDELWVKPPKAKGKSLNIEGLRGLELRVFRKNDGEYSFTSRIKAQLEEPVEAVVLTQSYKIRKLHKREFQRFAVVFDRDFIFLLSGEESKAEGDGYSGVKVTGTVADISLGGMKFSTQYLPPGTKNGTTVAFTLPEAKIKRGIQSTVVHLTDRNGECFVHIKFADLTELERLYLHKFIASKNPIAIKDEVK